MIGTLTNKLKALLNNKGYLKYLKSTSWLLAYKVISLISSLFVGVWLARYLGPSDYGMLNYVQSFVGLFSIFAGLGLDALIVRDLVEGKKDRDFLLGTSFFLKLFGALSIVIIISVSIFVLPIGPDNKSLVYIVAAGSFFQSFLVVDYYFQSEVKGKVIAIVNIISLLISATLKIIFILLSKPLIFFIWVLLIDSITVAIGFIVFYNTQKRSMLRWKFDLSLAKKLLSNSWPLILSGFVISIYMRIDQVMIKEYLGAEQVGQYAVAVRLSELWYFIPSIVSDSLFPAIVNARTNTSLYLKRLKNLYSLMIYMAVLIALPLTFFGDHLIELLYGSAYYLSSDVLSIHIWAGVFVFMGFVFHKYLIAENYTKLAFTRTLYGAIINVILNFILIPIYGIIGAAVATLVGQLVANYVFDLFDSRIRGQFILKTKSFFSLPNINT